jgi:hypothetical protein
MKRSVLLGLFVTASLMASSSFAAEAPDSLCDTNLKTIENAKTAYQSSPDLQGRVDESVKLAKADRAKGTKEGIQKCIDETNQTILEIRKVDGGSNN